ncbi:MAG TPA: tetratricopeptide repeat protein [Gaiellaceae bacterium]|nr:tetratricopeptide repeat protein [Gaiellaceae bacterium]
MDAPTAGSLLERSELAGPGLAGLDRKALFEELEERYDELLAALQWFLEAGRVDEAMRLARSLAPFWTATRRLAEASEWFDRVLAAPGGEAGNRGLACLEAGFLWFWQGDDEKASALFGQGLEIGRHAGDPTVTALALTCFARVALRTDVAEARRLCREALAVSEGTDDRRGRSNAVHVLGVAAQMAGDLVEARELMTKRIELARELGSFAGVASESGNLSMVERQLGNLDRAEALAREALDIARQREDEWLFPYLINGLAAVAAERGELERAATLIGGAEAMMEAQGAAWPPDERPHYEQTLAKLSEAMSPDDFERLRGRGRSFAARDAVEYAFAADR